MPIPLPSSPIPARHCNNVYRWILTSETGSTFSFNVVLRSPPIGNVIIPTITSSNTLEGTVSPNTLTFTPTNWNIPQPVTVTGVNDFIWDGNSGGIAGAGAICNSDPNKHSISPIAYKAMVVLGAMRRASLTANLGDSKVDWVLAANTNYFQSNGTTSIFTSGANGIFVFGSLSNSFDLVSGNYWTGLNSDWITSANICTSWNSTCSAVNGKAGNSSSTGSSSIDWGSFQCNNSFLQLICVQQ